MVLVVVCLLYKGLMMVVMVFLLYKGTGGVGGGMISV